MTWARLLATSLLLALVLAGARPALAQDDVITLWDQHIASAMNEMLTGDDPCRYGPYFIYRQTCVTNQLNITLERDPFERLTLLDRMAILVYKYKDLNLDQRVASGTELKFKLSLANVYQQEARAHLTLRLTF
jgi:hypothetical protein